MVNSTIILEIHAKFANFNVNNTHHCLLYWSLPFCNNNIIIMIMRLMCVSMNHAAGKSLSL